MDIRKAILILYAIGLFTFLRAYLILFSPFLIVFLWYLFSLKLTDKTLLSLMLLTFTLVVNGLFYKSYPLNNLISILLFYLGVLTLLMKPKRKYFSIHDWMKTSSTILLIVDATGLVNFLYVLVTDNGLLDDSFNGLYGRSGLSMHTLALVNFIYAVYFLEKKNYRLFLSFFVSGFFCFYGLGLILFIGALLLALLRQVKREYLKYVFMAPVIVALLLFIATSVNPNILSYMNKNIDRGIIGLSGEFRYEDEMEEVRRYETVKTPRKILMFKGAYSRMKEPNIFFFGMGPGTYNSRTSFLLNGEYTKNPIFQKIKVEPFFAKMDVYPLWNNNITYQYNDGTRNEPFSSIVSLFLEYGFVNGLLIIVSLLLVFKKLASKNRESILFTRFLLIFTFLNLLFENYFEYPEFMLLLIIITKSLECNNSVQNDS